MRRPGRDVRYRSNGLPAYNQRWGPRTRDEMTGFPTHRDRLIEDDFGLLIDPRYGTPDIDYGAPETGGNYVLAYLSAIGALPPEEQ